MSPTVDIKQWKLDKTKIEKQLIDGLKDALLKRDVEAFKGQLDRKLPELDRLYQEQSNSEDDGAFKNKKLRRFFGEMICPRDDHAQFVAPFLDKIPIVNEPVQQLRNQHPLHIAIQGKAFSVVETLLTIDGINVNAQLKNQTPLMLLIKMITPGNFEAVMQTIRLLASKGADINVGDYRAHPLSVVCQLTTIGESEKRRLLEFCKENFKCDVDSVFNGQARRDIEALFGDLCFGQQQSELSTASLKSLLLKGKEEEFVKGFYELYENLVREKKERDLYELLAQAAVKNRSLCVERMFSKCKNERVFETVEAKKKLGEVLKVVCCKGFVKVLKLFLKFISDSKVFNESALALICVRRLQKRRAPEMVECLDVLLQNSRINVDNADHLGMTALHFAVQHDMDEEALQIMTKGKPYLGQLNRFNKSPLHLMSATVLQRYLDWCISVEGVRSDDLGENIHINLAGFVPQTRTNRAEVTYTSTPTEETVENGISNSTFMNNAGQLFKALMKEPKRSDLLPESSVLQRNSKEIDPFGYIADSKELRPLLKHPVIMSILLVKWFQIQRILYLKLGKSVLLAVLFTLYAITDITKNTTLSWILWTCCFFLVATFAIVFVVVIFKSSNYCTAQRSSFKAQFNYMELIIFPLATVCLFNHNTTLLAILIVLAGINIVTHMGSLPSTSLSTSIVMLETVSRNFLKSLLIYVIILLAFGFGFFVLYSDSNMQDDSGFSSFKTLESSIIKSLVMLTGELDASAIEFKSKRASYILFLGFIFLVTLVIANLINGIAVSDISAIRQEAEVIALAKKVKTLAHYEEVNNRFNFNKKSFFSYYEPQLIVLPRENNKILAKPKRNPEPKDKAFHTWPLPRTVRKMFHLDNWCHSLDEDIVAAIRDILDARASGHAGQLQLNLKSYDERLLRLEEKIDLLLLRMSAGEKPPESAAGHQRWKKAATAMIGQYRLRNLPRRGVSMR
ncbi:hypothetical protein pipiens_008808 [Culex pipiens pipiens]|uniref:Transient receptor potential cation channel protein painless n=2 Tax=Culex pipiens TaxID=7175 RepID=A0ABD1DH56_CULPP